MEINRDNYLNQLILRKNNGMIKIITGIRRCGKMCRWEKLEVTAREVEENEPGSGDKEYRRHVHGIFLMETEKCSPSSFY